MFSEIIKKLRKERKFSQDEVANAIGLSAAALSKLENNKTLPMRQTKISLAKFYGSNFGESWLDEYISGEETPKSKKEIIEDSSVEEIFSIKFGGGAARRSKEDILKLKRLLDKKLEQMIDES